MRLSRNRVLSFWLRLTVAACLVGCPAAIHAQTPDQDGPSRIEAKLGRVLETGSIADLAALAPAISAEDLESFSSGYFVAGVTRAVARERDRQPLAEALEGDGYRLLVEVFSESSDHARIMTVVADARRPGGGDADSWRFVHLERLSFVAGLYRLALDTSSPSAVRELEVDSEDFRLVLHEGAVFKVTTDVGVTGLVLLGRGDMIFEPKPATEKGQMRLFAGSETLVAPFDEAFVRLNPDEYDTRVRTASLTPLPPDSRTRKRAADVFARESAKSFNLDLGDFSADRWFLVPGPGDFLTEVRTRKYGTLTYARNGNQAEDITLFQRSRDRTLSLYQSAERIASRGPFYNEDSLADYDVSTNELDLAIDPQREFIEGVARITLRSRRDDLATLTLRLADSLNVTNVTSVQLGQLLFLRVRNQNMLVVNLPVSMNLDTELTLIVFYSGRVRSQQIDRSEGLWQQQAEPDDLEIPLEPRYLLSNRSYWYPQNTVTDFATARLRIAVPNGYTCVASGELSTDPDVRLLDILTPLAQGRPMIFKATEPVRYLSVVTSRFVSAWDANTESGSAARRPGTSAETPSASDGPARVALRVQANPGQLSRGRQVAPVAEDILRFYGGIVDDTPYPSMTVAVVEDKLPGGHSPAYAVVLNSVPPMLPLTWRNDPAAFMNYPEFFIAHELAHQWWGQAVGWQNYHEQWLSEGFAQYFAALYAQRLRGDNALVDMLRQFRRWALSDSDEGPIYLGYRLGQVKNDPTVFRALVYNKGAGVLHMLRRLIGDDSFFKGLRRYYWEQKFRKAGTEDLRGAMEAESGMPLQRFFERWIYGASVPRLRYSTSIGAGVVTVRFDQIGETVFDIPVTVTINYSDGRVQDVMVPVTEKRTEQQIPTKGIVRQVQINKDAAALARFEE